MGKPFKSELLKLKDTYEWAMNLNLDLLKKSLLDFDSPIYFVGSGGSLSACYFAVTLAEQKGVFAKAVTPLEFYSVKNTIRNSTVVFISASGKNTDILFGFKMAIKFEAKKILSICLQRDSKIASLSTKYSISKCYDFDLPVGKDGFLATNSLIAYFTILNRLFSERVFKIDFSKSIDLNDISYFVRSLSKNTSITVLYNSFSKCVAFDIESKSVEAALFPILLSDYRNFGHGRHHWYAKKKDTAIIAIATIDDEFLAEKTLNALPNHIPKLLMKTNKKKSLGSIDLLIQSFYLIDKFGDSLGIDPGRPGVPDFGRKLYNLKYTRILTNSENDNELSIKAKTAISRKIKNPITGIDKKEIQIWEKSYSNFIKNLNKVNFGAVVFDYDGTICSSERKFDGPNKVMADKLNEIVKNGFYIGVVTGRGKSVRKDLQKVILKKHWSQVLIGYYNGADIGFLKDNSLPNLNLKNITALENLYNVLKYNKELEIECTLRPKQLTIEFNNEHNFSDLKESILQLVKSSGQKNIELLESSHSMDIIPSEVSKTDIFIPLKKILSEKKLPTDLLCIGDRGKWPGNDFRLLDTPYSLSVFEINNKKTSCWNLAPAGITHIDATIHYLNLLKFGQSGIKLKINK